VRKGEGTIEVKIENSNEIARENVREGEEER
jgi:hypothetical protein